MSVALWLAACGGEHPAGVDGPGGAVVVPGTGGAGTGGTAGATSTCASIDHSTYAAMPKVSFRDDVLPIVMTALRS